ncbi:MAG: ABC transporter ATP-binding protein [Waddliaceae bacterium]|nr:ABC transporter ATP-binding protein [Waddliaceae bacterium]
MNLSIEAGERCAIIGPSGCGKSTLLYLLAGILDPIRGTISIKQSTPQRRDTAIILQDYGLLPWKTVEQNVLLGLKIRGQNKDSHFVETIMSQLKINELRKRYPHQLSGGQKQRVAIGRALVLEPDLLLMDEPFSALDAPTREALQDLILHLCSQSQITTVFVTHNIEEAAVLGERIFLFSENHLEEIKNPQSRDKDFRDSSAFHLQCKAIRHAMKGVSHA